MATCVLCAQTNPPTNTAVPSPASRNAPRNRCRNRDGILPARCRLAFRWSRASGGGQACDSSCGGTRAPALSRGWKSVWREMPRLCCTLTSGAAARRSARDGRSVSACAPQTAAAGRGRPLRGGSNAGNPHPDVSPEYKRPESTCLSRDGETSITLFSAAVAENLFRRRDRDERYVARPSSTDDPTGSLPHLSLSASPLRARRRLRAGRAGGRAGGCGASRIAS